jgi:hypothetical protein
MMRFHWGEYNSPRVEKLRAKKNFSLISPKETPPSPGSRRMIWERNNTAERLCLPVGPESPPVMTPHSAGWTIA